MGKQAEKWLERQLERKTLAEISENGADVAKRCGVITVTFRMQQPHSSHLLHSKSKPAAPTRLVDAKLQSMPRNRGLYV